MRRKSNLKMPENIGSLAEWFRRKGETPGPLQRCPILERSTQDALLRLTSDPEDACAVVAVYDALGNHLKGSAVRWFGRNVELRSRAVLNMLVAIARQAGSYDPLSMNPSEWVSRVADAEARRLRETLDTAASKSIRTRRTV